MEYVRLRKDILQTGRLRLALYCGNQPLGVIVGGLCSLPHVIWDTLVGVAVRNIAPFARRWVRFPTHSLFRSSIRLQHTLVRRGSLLHPGKSGRADMPT